MAAALSSTVAATRTCAALHLGCQWQRRQLATTAAASAGGAAAKTGVLMLNMGGPRTADDVEMFLTRLFLDRDIIKLPFQSWLGPLIAKRRTPSIIEKYNEIGGGSPIYDWTKKQGDLLCRKLDAISPSTGPHKAYIGFRYAPPLTEDTLRQMEADGVERCVAFSQYPQYSCTTSGSSMTAIAQHFNKSNPTGMEWGFIDRWGTHPGLIRTFADNIRTTLRESFPDESKRKKVVFLFSAHSVPQYVMDRGDTYPSEIGATVHLVMQELGFSNPYRLVWQSKVGPLPWLKPGTEETIKVMVKRGHRNLMLIPIAFVNEHIETLHELDIEYADEVGKECGAEKIARCPTPNDHPAFIDAMADVVSKHLSQGPRVSPQLLMRCPNCTNANCAKQKAWIGKITRAGPMPGNE